LDVILREYARRGRIALTLVEPDDLTGALDAPVDLVVVSQVMFNTGRCVGDLDEVVRRTHRAGGRVLLDIYHSLGVLPVNVHALDVDFAVGGSYKYLRGGPGACWLYVHPRHHGLRTLDTGWFAKEDVFAYRRPEPPRFAAGGDAWLESTPPVLTPFQALAGLEITLELGVARIRDHNLEQKAILKSLLPVDGAGDNHGAFVTLRNAQAKALSAELEKNGVKTDARGEYLRICPDYLNSREELQSAAANVAELIERERL
ncbi:MAG: aminotransferase class V-fold PLP-dependent enzyme, partial [Burkholderiales bacterium]